MLRLKHLWPSLVISALWLMLALLFAFQQRLSGGPSWTWSRAFAVSLAEWGPWMVMSPLIFWAAGKFPLERASLWRWSLVNVPLTVVAILLAEYTFQTVNRVGLSQPASVMGPREPADGPDDAGRPAPPSRPVGRGGPMQHLMHFHLPICLFTVMAAHAYAYFRRYQDKERKAVELAASLAEARLMALQMQLQPHFLFNALNAMSALVHSNPQAADDMIANLSELLRRALSAGQHKEITLEQEIDYAECYLDIERVRFGSRLQVEWRVEPDAKAAIVPNLILQPIVENAVRHGVERRMAEIGCITITAGVAGDRLRVTVTDNGPGLPAVPAAPRGHGIGVGNTRARLASLYGDAASITLTNAPEGGCIATLKLPFRKTNPLA